MDKSMDIKDFKDIVSQVLEAESEVNLDLSFVQNGGYSLVAINIVDLLYPRTGVVLNFLDLMGEKTLNDVFKELDISSKAESDEKTTGIVL